MKIELPVQSTGLRRFTRLRKAWRDGSAVQVGEVTIVMKFLGTGTFYRAVRVCPPFSEAHAMRISTHRSKRFRSARGG